MFSQPCEPVQPLKFYIYQLQSFRACSFSEPGARELLLERIRTLSAEDRQRIAGGLFLEQHLSEHPWRTLDPEEADLFVVPSVLDLAAASLCTTQGVPSTGPPPARVKSRVPFSLSESLGPFMDELAASPYYQRSQGRDHLMVWLHYHVRNIFMPRKPGKPVPGLKSSDASRFRHLVRNFILGQKHARSTVVHSKTWDMRMPGTCVFTVPHLAPSALDRCQWEESHPQGKEQRPRLHCPPDPREGVPESSFEEYLKNRNHTLFFSGNVGRDQEPPLRRAAVKQLAAVHPPNILVAYEGRTKALQLPPCAVSADGTVVPAPCRAAGVAGAGLFRRQMTRSRFSLHIKGDDATSSRVFEAWDTGTLQIFLADRYHADVAAFRCRVPWAEAVKTIPEQEFAKDAEGSVSRAAAELYADGAAAMRRMWERQREAAPDVLWHLPGSRVGRNVVEDAARCLARRNSMRGSLRRNATTAWPAAVELR